MFTHTSGLTYAFQGQSEVDKKYKVSGINSIVDSELSSQEIINELSNKVSWPTWEELQTSSVIVLVTSIILALIIWLMDYAFGIWSVPEGEWGWKGILGFIYELIQ